MKPGLQLRVTELYVAATTFNQFNDLMVMIIIIMMMITDENVKMICEQQPALLKVDLVCWAGQATPGHDDNDDHEDEIDSKDD